LSEKVHPMPELADLIKTKGMELGFQQVAITDTELGHHGDYLKTWLEKNRHGEMGYMAKNLEKRLDPKKLVPGTKRIIITRMNYFPPNTHTKETLQNKEKGYVSRYALGRDYHKLIRKRLQRLANFISEQTEHVNYRVFVDSGPVMEKAFAEKAGLGWIGKNTLLLNKEAGSYFFLGVLLTNLELPIDTSLKEKSCGKCSACITICPTKAIVAPGELDARRCISYLTIEHRGSIPIELRSLIGNRIYGCDDCQIICPWNRYAKLTSESDFHARHQLENSDLIKLFLLDENAFKALIEGSAMKRVNYECWLRNIAVALGNAPTGSAVIDALRVRSDHSSELVREHVAWALGQHKSC
jgi:epoxyqueuosine reductase